MTQRGECRWYVVQTYSGYENRVKADLEQRIATMGMEEGIFNVLVPIEDQEPLGASVTLLEATAPVKLPA